MYKDILVHLDSSNTCEKRIESALQLAQTFNSHLTGVFVVEPVQLPAYAEVAIGADLLEQNRRESLNKANEVLEQFRQTVDKEQIPNETRLIEGMVITSLVNQSHHSDLIVMGQKDPKDINDISFGLVDQVVMSSGRPIMTIPYIGAGKTLGSRVLLAWNESREAVRALHDAMPILQNAKEVVVMNINSERKNQAIPDADIGIHLARHNVRATVNNTIAKELGIGDTLLSRAADLDVDCIVMGAYGHSRLRELVMGGATKHILQHMTVPVLMSH